MVISSLELSKSYKGGERERIFSNRFFQPSQQGQTDLTCVTLCKKKKSRFPLEISTFFSFLTKGLTVHSELGFILK